MTTRISRDFGFLAGIHYEGSYIINQYDISLTMDVHTDSIDEQNIAMDRIKYFVDDIISNSVFVEDKETKALEKYKQAGMRICVLPEEPYDQIIALLILYKLNAICEQKIAVTNIQLNSILSDGVGFMFDIEETALISAHTHGWWTENSLSIGDTNTIGKKEKVVKLVKKSDWSTLGLDYKQKKPKSTEIIFTPEIDK